MSKIHKSAFSEMPFSKFLEIGRITVMGDGPESGKIAAILNVIDQNRVLHPAVLVHQEAAPDLPQGQLRLQRLN